MNINEQEIGKYFVFTESDGRCAIRIDTKDQMKELFEKHRADGFVCCGYDWCTLVIAFIEHSDQLRNLWNAFDYEPSDDELYISSGDGSALNTLIHELKGVYNDTDYIEYLMSQIDYREMEE